MELTMYEINKIKTGIDIKYTITPISVVLIKGNRIIFYDESGALCKGVVSDYYYTRRGAENAVQKLNNN